TVMAKPTLGNTKVVYGSDNGRSKTELFGAGAMPQPCKRFLTLLTIEESTSRFREAFWPCSWPTTWLIPTLRGRGKMTSGLLEAAKVTPVAVSYASVDRCRVTTKMTFESWRKSYGDSGKNRTAVLQLSVIHPFDSSAS